MRKDEAGTPCPAAPWAGKDPPWREGTPCHVAFAPPPSTRLANRNPGPWAGGRGPWAVVRSPAVKGVRHAAPVEGGHAAMAGRGGACRKCERRGGHATNANGGGDMPQMRKEGGTCCNSELRGGHTAMASGGGSCWRREDWLGEGWLDVGAGGAGGLGAGGGAGGGGWLVGRVCRTWVLEEGGGPGCWLGDGWLDLEENAWLVMGGRLWWRTRWGI